MTTVVDIEFRASSNISEISAQVAQVNAALKGMNDTLRTVKPTGITEAFKTFNDTMARSGQYVTSLHNIQAAEATWGKQMAENKLGFKAYNKEMQNFVRGREGMIKQLAKQQLAIQNSIVKQVGTDATGRKVVSVNTPTGFDSSGAAAAQMLHNKQMQIFTEVVSKASGKVIDMGKNIQWAGRQMMVGLTIPIGLFGAAAGKAFLDMDAGLVRLQKVYGDLNTNLTGDQIKNLRAEVVGLAQDLAGKYGTSMTDTIQLAGDFAATGQQGVDLINSTRAAVRLATLGEVDRAAAMQTTLSLTAAFKVPTKDLANTVNFLNAVENQTSLTLQDMTEAIPRAGVVVKGLGGDVKDLALYMVAMKEGGVNAAQGANAIKSGLTSIIAPSKKATEYLKGLNIDLPAIVKANAGDITSTILSLKKALDSLDPLSRQSALAQLFGKYQVARMTALFNNLGADGSQTKRVMELMQASTKQLAGVADRELAQITESASGKWNRALETMRATLATVGETFLQVGTIALNVANWMLKAFGGMPDWLKNFLTWGAVIAALVGPIVMVGGVLLNFLGTIVKGGLIFNSLIRKIRGAGDAYSYLTPEMQAAELLSKSMSSEFFNQTKAIETVTAAIKDLQLALQGIEGVAPAVVGELSAIVALGKDAILAPQGGGGLWQATQRGHSITRDTYRKSFIGKDDQGRKQYQDPTLRYGLSMGTESIESNKDKRSATYYGGAGTENMKKFGLNAAVTGAASQEAWQSVLNGVDGAIAKKLRDLLASTEKAMNGTLGKSNAGELQAGIRAQFNAAANKIAPAFSKMFDGAFTVASEALATEAARVGALTEEQVLGELKIAAETLKFDYQKLMEMIDAGLITARDQLVVMTTSMQSAGRLGVSPVTGSKAGEGKAGYTGANVQAIRTGNNRTVDMEEAINLEHQRAAALRQEIAATDVAIAQNEAKTSKKRLKGIGGKVGMAGMAASMIPMMMNDTGNASLDNGLSIAGSAGMGASMGAMIGPWGALAGGIVGAAIPAVSQLMAKMSELGNVTKAAFSVGEDAAQRYGVTVNRVQDLTLSQFTAGNKVRLSQIQQISDAMSKAPEGSADNTLVNFIKGEGDMNSIMGRMKERAAQLVIAGVKPEDVQNQIAGILTAAGKSSYITAVNTEIKLNMTTAKGALQDQINDALTKINPDVSAMRDKIKAAFGADSQQIAESLVTNPTSMIADRIPGGTAAYAELYKQMQNLDVATQQMVVDSQSLNSAIGPTVETLANAAMTMPTSEFMSMADSLQYGALSGQTFAAAFSQIPGIGADTASAMQNLANQGWSTQQMLQGISLVTAGVISSWQELQGLAPARLTVIYETYQAEQGLVSSFGKAAGNAIAQKAAAARQQATNATAADNKAAGGGGGGANKAGKAKSDALEKQKKKIQEYYDNEIKKVKEADKAKQDAAAAEKLRIERQKRDLNSLIDYRTALAAGDFAAAAKIKNDADANKKQDKLDDAAKKQQNATDARIAALEKERDAKLAAIQKVLDAQNKANSASSAGAAKTGASQINAATVAANEIAAKWDKLGTTIAGIMDNPALTWQEKLTEMVNATAHSGLNMASAMEASLKSIKWGKGFENTGSDIFNAIKNDLRHAPWSLVGEVVSAAMAGNNGLLTRKLNQLTLSMSKHANAATKAQAGKIANLPMNAATGGHIRGPGTGTSDDIPAWLSNGEYVMTAKTVQKYGPHFFDKLNAGKYANGGMAIGGNAVYHALASAMFSQGGQVKYSSGGPVSGNMAAPSVSYGDIEVNILQPGATKEEIVQAVFKAIELKEKKKGPQR